MKIQLKAPSSWMVALKEGKVFFDVQEDVSTCLFKVQTQKEMRYRINPEAPIISLPGEFEFADVLIKAFTHPYQSEKLVFRITGKEGISLVYWNAPIKEIPGDFVEQLGENIDVLLLHPKDETEKQIKTFIELLQPRAVCAWVTSSIFPALKDALGAKRLEEDFVTLDKKQLSLENTEMFCFVHTHA